MLVCSRLRATPRQIDSARCSTPSAALSRWFASATRPSSPLVAFNSRSRSQFFFSLRSLHASSVLATSSDHSICRRLRRTIVQTSARAFQRSIRLSVASLRSICLASILTLQPTAVISQLPCVRRAMFRATARTSQVGSAAFNQDSFRRCVSSRTTSRTSRAWIGAFRLAAILLRCLVLAMYAPARTSVQLLTAAAIHSVVRISRISFVRRSSRSSNFRTSLVHLSSRSRSKSISRRNGSN